MISLNYWLQRGVPKENILMGIPCYGRGFATKSWGTKTDEKPLYNAMVIAKNFIYSPFQTGNLYYRLKVTSVLDQTVYSNIIVLKATANVDNQYYVSTLVRDEIMINASQNYNYRLTDANGRIISSGNGIKGINKIDISNKAAGMYIIQLINNNQIKSERIIKQ